MIKLVTSRPKPRRKPFGTLPGWAAALILVSLLSAFVATPLQAQSVATVRPYPTELALSQGETAVLEIRLENARDLYGIDVSLSFDPVKLEIIDADPNQAGIQMIPGAFPKADLVALNTADNAAGTARYVVTQLNPTPPATGSGVVLSVQLRARAAGETELALPSVEMSDRDGNLLAVNTGSTSITVRGNPASATGIPIQPPGGGATGDTASSTATVASTPATGVATPAAATPESAAAAPPLNPPSSGQTTAEAMPITPATAVAETTGGTGAAESAGIGAVEVTTLPAEPTGSRSEADQAASDAISDAIAAAQSGAIPVTTREQTEATQAPPTTVPQVIGQSSNPTSGMPESVTPAPPESGRLSTGVMIAVVAVIVLAGFLALIRLNRRRGKTD